MADINDKLIAASLEGNIDYVKYLLSQGADPNIGNIDGFTALMAASRDAHTDVVRFLLSHGADPNIANRDNWTALMGASWNGHADIVRVILFHGADPDIANKDGFTALMGASRDGHIGVVKTLVDGVEYDDYFLYQGADPNIRNRDGFTALLWASLEGHAEIVEHLLTHGADPNTANSEGFTALMAASRDGRIDVVKSLLVNHDDILENLIADPNIRNRDGFTALLWASLKGHAEIVENLLIHGADPDISNSDGFTALMAASRDGRIDIVKALLLYGADPSMVNRDGFTALWFAGYKGHSDIVETLLTYVDQGSSKTVVGQSGSELTLACDIGVHSDLTFLTWVKDGANINLSQTPGVEAKYSGGTVMNPDLTIRDLDENFDPGNYTCVATNASGRVNSETIAVRVSPSATKWQFGRGFTDKGGNLQVDGSDVVLKVPPNAVPKDQVLEVHGEIYTNIPKIKKRLSLSKDELLVTPVVEYTGSSTFERNVTLHLPHVLPENFDTKDVRVYTYTVDDRGNIEKSLVPYGRGEHDMYWEEDTDETKICITTPHFSGYYCTLREQSGLSCQGGAVFGSFVKLHEPKRYSLSIVLHILDRVYKLPDFWTNFKREQQILGRQMLTDIKDIPLLTDADLNSHLAMKLKVIQDKNDYWKHTAENEGNFVFPPLQVKRLVDIKQFCSLQDTIKIEWSIEGDEHHTGKRCQDFNCSIVVSHLPTETRDLDEALEKCDTSLKQTFLVRGFRAALSRELLAFPHDRKRGFFQRLNCARCRSPTPYRGTPRARNYIIESHRKSTLNEFSKFKVKLSKELHEEHLVEQLAWLTEEDYKILGDSRQAARLLDKLTEAAKISGNDCTYLKHPLELIDRKDLVDFIPEPMVISKMGEKINEDRIFLYSISRKLKQEEIRDLSYLTTEDKNQSSALSLFAAMVKKYGGNRPELTVAKKLIDPLETIDRNDLAKEIGDYLHSNPAHLTL